jgi:hypothetical protein
VSGGRTLLITIEIIAASVWIGSLVCLALVSRVAGQTLDGPSRVALFRGIGRLYGIVGSACLVIALFVGFLLVEPVTGGADAALIAACVVLLVVSVAGMLQARRMTVRRGAANDAPQSASAARAVQHGAAVAGVLRASIAVVTLAIVVLSAHQLAT